MLMFKFYSAFIRTFSLLISPNKSQISTWSHKNKHPTAFTVFTAATSASPASEAILSPNPNNNYTQTYAHTYAHSCIQVAAQKVDWLLRGLLKHTRGDASTLCCGYTSGSNWWLKICMQNYTWILMSFSALPFFMPQFYLLLFIFVNF